MLLNLSWYAHFLNKLGILHFCHMPITSSLNHQYFVDQFKAKQLASGMAVSDPLMTNTVGSKADSGLCLPVGQARSSLSLSFSGLTGESSAGDYQDCGVSSMLLMGEPPWFASSGGGPDTASLASVSRDSALNRYKEKKKKRKWAPLFISLSLSDLLGNSPLFFHSLQNKSYYLMI